MLNGQTGRARPPQRIAERPDSCRLAPAYITAPICQGVNSWLPRPSCSDAFAAYMLLPLVYAMARAMRPWSRTGLVGSLRHFVNREVRKHLRTNEALVDRRHRLGTRVLRCSLRKWAAIAIAVLYLAVILVPLPLAAVGDSLPYWAVGSMPIPTELRGLLKDANGYLLTIQATLIAIVFPIAVALVTVIVQRAHASSTNAHVQIYYSEALALQVGLSSILLVVVLIIQMYVATGTDPWLRNRLDAAPRQYALATLNVAWFAFNALALWHFLRTSFQFIDPAGRAGLRERFTTNVSLPQHLRHELFREYYRNAARGLASEATGETQPLLIFGSTLLSTETVEVERLLGRTMALTDVWGRPLLLALTLWQRRSTVKPSQHGSIDRPVLVFDPQPYWPMQGSVIVCRRRGGLPFTRRERFLVRASFRFGRYWAPEFAKPEEILEELADEVLGQLARMAIVGFKDALNMLCEYHGFLVQAYLLAEGGSRVSSYAEKVGGWGRLHWNWTRPYRRIIERAVSIIDRDDDFLGLMMYLPNRLLADNASHMTPEMAGSTLRLGVAVAARLEDWAKDRSLQPERTPDSSPELSLNPTDRRRYEQTIRRFVGAWENVTLMAGSYYGWSREASAHAAWSRLVASWPLLWEHLRSTATLVMLALLHSDRFAAETYVDALLKWLEKLKLHLHSQDLISDFLTPELLEPDWNEVNAKGTRFLPRGVGQATPAAVFLGVLQNIHRDATLVMEALLLSRGMTGAANATLAGDLMLQLLRHHGWDHGGSFPPAGGARFQHIFRTLVRVLLSPDFLDGLVESLDQLGEPDRIPGRVYTRTVHHRAQDLRLQFLALLIAVYEGGAHDLTDRQVTEYLDFIDGSYYDEGLRTLHIHLSQIVNDLVHRRDEINQMHNQVAKEAQFVEKSEYVTNLFETLITQIHCRRTSLICRMPVDAHLINAIADHSEKSLIEIKESLDFFGDATVARISNCVHQRSILSVPVSKGGLVTPLMDDPPGHERIAELVRMHAVGEAWRVIWQRADRREAGSPETYFEILRINGERLRRRGLRPLLLVWGWSDPDWIRSWINDPESRLPGMSVVRTSDSTGYLATINDVDVFATQEVGRGTSLIVYRELLRRVRFAEAADEQIIEVRFVQPDDTDPWQGELEISFGIAVELHDEPTVSLAYAPCVPV
jgi:hypothetical protein